MLLEYPYNRVRKTAGGEKWFIMEKDSGMFERIYKLVSRVPEGKVATYGQIALMAGHPRAARMVGFALGRAHEGLPCHRIVNRLGTLAPGDVFGGRDFQRRLLEGEGVTFREDGRIDMERHLWNREGD